MQIRNIAIIAHPSSTAKLTTGHALTNKQLLWK
jgi:hypothetical protein